jgi:hypothetical protein
VERGCDISNDDIKQFITFTLDVIRKHEYVHARIASVFKTSVFIVYSFVFLSNGTFFTINNACEYSEKRMPFIYETMQVIQTLYDVFYITRKKSKVLRPTFRSYKETFGRLKENLKNNLKTEDEARQAAIYSIMIDIDGYIQKEHLNKDKILSKLVNVNLKMLKEVGYYGHSR